MLKLGPKKSRSKGAERLQARLHTTHPPILYFPHPRPLKSVEPPPNTSSSVSPITDLVSFNEDPKEHHQRTAFFCHAKLPRIGNNEMTAYARSEQIPAICPGGQPVIRPPGTKDVVGMGFADILRHATLIVCTEYHGGSSTCVAHRSNDKPWQFPRESETERKSSIVTSCIQGVVDARHSERGDLQSRLGLVNGFVITRSRYHRERNTDAEGLAKREDI